MESNILHRTISLERYKSRFPGIIPYIDDNDLGYSLNDKDTNNWGKIPMDIIPNNNNVFKGLKPTYLTKDNKRVYCFMDIDSRYLRMVESVRKFYKVKRAKNGITDDSWVLEPGDYDTLVLNYDKLMDSEIVLDGGLDAAIYDFENFGNVTVIENREDGLYDDILYVIPDYDFFIANNGHKFIDEYEKYRGVLRVPSDIEGDLVPAYIIYSEIAKRYEWMKKASACCIDKVNDRYEKMGGKKMLDFLKKNISLLDKQLTYISKNNTFKFPDINISINLTQKLEDIGAMYEDYSEEIYSENWPPVNNPNITMTGESELFGLKERNVLINENEDGVSEFNALLKSNRQEDGKLLVCKKSGKSWKFSYLSQDEINKDSSGSEYVSIETFAQLNEDYAKKKVIVKYDNGSLVFTDEEIGSCIINKKDGKRALYYGKNNNMPIEVWGGVDFPPEDSNIVYYLRYDIHHSFLRAGDYVRFNDKSLSPDKWDTIKLPKIEVAEVTYDDLIKIESSIDKKDIKYYYPKNKFQYVVIDDKGKYKFYKATDATVPFVKRKPYNAYEYKNPDGYTHIADFITSIERGNGRIQFTYVLNSPCVIENGKVMSYPNIYTRSETDTSKYGIFFKESYPLSTGNIEKIGTDNSFNYIYEKALFEENAITVESEKLNIDRKTLLSEITFRGNDIWDNENVTSNPVFKVDFLNKVTAMNRPSLDVVYNRGNAAAFEPYLKLMECNTISDMENYGNNYFNIR